LNTSYVLFNSSFASSGLSTIEFPGSRTIAFLQVSIGIIFLDFLSILVDSLASAVAPQLLCLSDIIKLWL